ncbi:MAG: response regulator transcription factor, partial [Chloroflexota bacterium]|nr:response regulator transcription factor [Chloroflexota bacterium]
MHREIEIVGEADDGVQAVRLAQELLPTVVLMDLLLPTLDGIEATRQIRACGLTCAVLMLTSSVQPTQIQAAIRAGAAGYVLKTTRGPALIDAIGRAARGLRVLDPIAADALLGSLAQPDALAELTPREHQVLSTLALGHSNAGIADLLMISEATVRTHIANVFSKLNLRDRTHATIFALKRGLVSLDEMV